MKILLDIRVTVTFLRAFQPSAGLSHWKIGTRQTCMKWLLISVNSVNSYSAVLPPSPMVFCSQYESSPSSPCVGFWWLDCGALHRWMSCPPSEFSQLSSSSPSKSSSPSSCGGNNCLYSGLFHWWQFLSSSHCNRCLYQRLQQLNKYSVQLIFGPVS